MRMTSAWILTAALGVIAPAATAQDRLSTADAQTDLALPVYGNGLALVRDRREVDLPIGVKELAISGVSPQMIADSLDLDLGPDVRVLTRTLRPANLNPRSLLEAHLGKPAQLIRRHPETGAETVVAATPVSLQGGVIARIGGRLVSNPEGRWAFPSMPPHLRAEPVLAVRAESASAGARPIGLGYLAGGVSWRPAYTANWDRKAGKIRLSAWAVLKNSSAMDFGNARVKVVAGQVRRVSAAPRPAPRAALMMKAEAAQDAGLAVRESFAGYHLYDLPQRVSLKRGDEVHAALLKPLTVEVRHELVSEGHPAVFGRVRGGAPRPTHPAIRLTFQNPKDDAAQPLPAGTMRLYGADSGGTAQFMGEDRIGDVPVGGEVMVNAGNAFDVTVKRRQTDFRRENRDNFEAAFAIDLQNGGAEAASVKVVESLPGDWRMADTDKPHTRENNQAVWRVVVPARGTLSFSYRVAVRN